MHKLYDLKEKLCYELEQYEGKENFSAADIDRIDDLTDIVKNLGKIIKMSEEEESYSSMADHSYRGGRYEGRYEGSYARGIRRDDMGRYSRADEDIIKELEHLADRATDRKTKQEIDRLVTKMEKM